MASDSGKLTVLKVKAAQPGKHFDGGGLFLHVTDAGRYWRMKYRYAGKEKLLALGVYPEVGLSEARQRRDAARTVLRGGNDPALVKRDRKVANVLAAGNTFAAIGEEWLKKQKSRMAEATYTKAAWTLSDLVNPWIGHRPVTEIDAAEMLKLLRACSRSS